jgi:hypothetical protein
LSQTGVDRGMSSTPTKAFGLILVRNDLQGLVAIQGRNQSLWAKGIQFSSMRLQTATFGFADLSFHSVHLPFGFACMGRSPTGLWE